MLGKWVVASLADLRDAVDGQCTIWHHANLENNVTLGEGVVIGSSTYVGNGATIGERTRIQHGAFVCRNARIAHDVFIGPGVMLLDDPYPEANNEQYEAFPPTLESHCSIGAGAIILPGVTVGTFAMVGAGAVVTQHVPPYAVVTGVPASLHIQKKSEAKNPDDDKKKQVKFCHTFLGYTISLEIGKRKRDRGSKDHES